jgi:hypothetical protein
MEHNEPKEKNITFKDRVLKDIETNDVKAYSKAHFVFRMVLLIVIAVVVLLISIFLFNYLFFTLRTSGRGSLLEFGLRGLIPFIVFFPWLLLLLDIFLIFILEWLLRKFRFGYRTPVIYLLLALMAVSISAGYFIDRVTGFNEALLRDADAHSLYGPFGDFYENANRPPIEDSMCKCVITSIQGNIIGAEGVTENGTTSLTIITPENYPALTSLKVGDIIFVLGTRTASQTIQAFGFVNHF